MSANWPALRAFGVTDSDVLTEAARIVRVRGLGHDQADWLDLAAAEGGDETTLGADRLDLPAAKSGDETTLGTGTETTPEPASPRPEWLLEDDLGRFTTTPTMHGYALGVRLSMIGEDGDWIALGHVPPLRMLAAMRQTGRALDIDDDALFGDRDSDGEPVRLVDNVLHTRAVFTRHRDLFNDSSWWCYTSVDAQLSEHAVDVTMWRV